MRSTRIVEIIGPAGSGKSTLAAAMARRAECVSLNEPPDPRTFRNLPFYARNLVATLPVLARMGLPILPEGHFSREPIASVVILNGWTATLAHGRSVMSTRARADTPRVILLDQGPLFRLAELHGRGPLGLLRQTEWWDAMYTHWAGVLDGVVSLDADDAVLIPRIHSRGTDHRIKSMSDPLGRHYLTQWRGALSYVLTHLMDRSSKLLVLPHDTSGNPPDALADLILRELDAEGTAQDSSWP